VKKSGRDELMWVVIHMCMEAMLRISLYSYLYLKVAKTIRLSYYLLYFPFNKIGEGRMGGMQEERVNSTNNVYTCK
jgi:hypothetical protein